MTVPFGEPHTDHSEWHEMRAALSEALGQLAMRGGYGVGVLASERLAVDLLPAVRKIAADELRAAADDLDAKSAETWKAYKTASPDDPRRANPYYDGAADAYETAATRVLRRADALDPS